MPAYLSKFDERGHPVLHRQRAKSTSAAIAEALAWVSQPGRTAQIFTGKNNKFASLFEKYEHPTAGQRPNYCKKCGSGLDKRCCCTYVACPYHPRWQHETYTEG